MSNKKKKRAELIMGELIGRKTKIIGNTDQSKEGLKGKIIDETLNTIKIETPNKKEKIIPKKTSKFKFNTDNQEITIQGKKIQYRPEDRIKKKWRQYNDLYR